MRPVLYEISVLNEMTQQGYWLRPKDTLGAAIESAKSAVHGKRRFVVAKVYFKGHEPMEFRGEA